jgi:flagellar motor switch protein FliN
LYRAGVKKLSRFWKNVTDGKQAIDQLGCITVSFQRGFTVTENEKNNLVDKAKDTKGVKTAGAGDGKVKSESMEKKATGTETSEAAGQGNAGAPAGGERGISGNWNIDLLLDLELPVRVSFGQTEMLLRDVFKLGAGSIIELNKSVNDPVTVIINDKPIAKGEVVMVDGNYGVRILEVQSTADRIRSLG